jgi:hypothetical protein
VTRSLIAFALIMAAVPALAHWEWSWIMRDPKTAWCCQPRDCRPLADGEARQVNGTWTVNGYPVASRSVYPSRDPENKYWACFHGPELTRARCLFVPLIG